MTGPAPAVSVVTPVFNAGAALARTIDSVAAQSHRDWEHVLVDDGSTDATTRRILDDVGRRPGVTVIRTENRGPAHARNLAITRSRGHYVLPLDADDTLDPDFLARTVSVLDAEPAVGLVHPWIRLTGGHVGVWRTGPFTLPALLARCTVHVTCLFRRELWDAVGGFDPAFVETGEDWDFWIRLAARGVVAREVPEVLASYTRRPGSRDDTARGDGGAGAVMQRLLAKHQALHATHHPEVIARLFDEVTRLGRTLQRIYALPLVGAVVRARRWASGADR
jgi:glycosyltransferase involved in cell wall biosynthesis